MPAQEPYKPCPYATKSGSYCPLWDVDCESFGVLYDSKCKQMGKSLRQLDEKDMRLHPIDYKGLKV